MLPTFVNANKLNRDSANNSASAGRTHHTSENSTHLGSSSSQNATTDKHSVTSLDAAKESSFVASAAAAAAVAAARASAAAATAAAAQAESVAVVAEDETEFKAEAEVDDPSAAAEEQRERERDCEWGEDRARVTLDAGTGTPCVSGGRSPLQLLTLAVPRVTRCNSLEKNGTSNMSNFAMRIQDDDGTTSNASTNTPHAATNAQSTQDFVCPSYGGAANLSRADYEDASDRALHHSEEMLSDSERLLVSNNEEVSDRALQRSEELLSESEKVISESESARALSEQALHAASLTDFEQDPSLAWVRDRRLSHPSSAATPASQDAAHASAAVASASSRSSGVSTVDSTGSPLPRRSFATLRTSAHKAQLRVTTNTRSNVGVCIALCSRQRRSSTVSSCSNACLGSTTATGRAFFSLAVAAIASSDTNNVVTSNNNDGDSVTAGINAAGTQTSYFSSCLSAP